MRIPRLREIKFKVTQLECNGPEFQQGQKTRVLFLTTR